VLRTTRPARIIRLRIVSDTADAFPAGKNEPLALESSAKSDRS
jgi:hypothetical protein